MNLSKHFRLLTLLLVNLQNLMMIRPYSEEDIFLSCKIWRNQVVMDLEASFY